MMGGVMIGGRVRMVRYGGTGALLSVYYGDPINSNRHNYGKG